jgi:hypothetical protein
MLEAGCLMIRTPKNARYVVAAVALAFLVSACTGGANTTPTSSATSPGPTSPGPTSPGPTTSPTRGPAEPEYGPGAVHVSSARVKANKLTIVIVGPEDATFRVRPRSRTITACTAKKGPLDATAAKGSPPNSVQHYTVTCVGASDDKNSTLLTKLKLGSFSYEFENPLVVTS